MSVELGTEYLGLALESPLVASASPLSRSLDDARRLEDAGAAALVMYSLFEEDLSDEEETLLRFVDHAALGHAEADGFLPQPHGYRSGLERYVEQLAALKRHLGIPVIASLNGISLDGWVQHGRELEQAGADALELNVFHVPASPAESSDAVEQRYCNLAAALRAVVQVPFAMKLSPHFSAPLDLARRLESVGADGVVLFNRFYQPDIDLDTLDLVYRPSLSRPGDVLQSLRWIALLHGHVQISIGATGGVHGAGDVLKLLLAGADVTQMCSALLQHGPERLREIRNGLLAWMETHEFESVRQLKGSLSRARRADPASYERVHYRKVLDGWRAPPGVWR